MAANLVIDITAQDDASPALQRIKEKFDKIQNSTKPLSSKLSNVKKLMIEMASAGKDNSPMYRRMAEAAAGYQRQLQGVNETIREQIELQNQAGKGIDFKGFASKIGKSVGIDLGGVMEAVASPAGMAAAGITAVGTTLVAAAKAAADFEEHLDGLQSLTGLSDGEMKAISDGAREMGKNFRASAGEIVDSMKLIGSQAPGLLKDKDALMAVTKSANVLAEAAQIDVVSAAKGITTTMNQMGVSAAEADNIINVLAASSQQGSADVAYLNTAFEKAGTAAKSAGMDYAQLAAVVETIAPKFSSADVAGSQLSSMLLKLSMQGNSKFKPAVVGMSEALANLAAAEMDDAEMKALVGESNVTMLKSLIEGRSTFDGYTNSLKDTNTAYEQMAINNDNLGGKIAHLKSLWDDFLIGLGQSSFMETIIEEVEAVMDVIGVLLDEIGNIIKSFELFGSEGGESFNIVKAAATVLMGVLRGVSEAIQFVVAVIAKAFNALRDGFRNTLGGAADWIKAKWDWLMDTIRKMLDTIKGWWKEVRKWVGLDTEEFETGTKPKPAETSTDTKIDITTASTGSSKTATKTVKIVYDTGSLADYEARLKAINDILQNRTLDDATVMQYAKEAEALQKQIDLLKARNQLTNDRTLDGGTISGSVTMGVNLSSGVGSATEEMRTAMDDYAAKVREAREETRAILDGMGGDMGQMIGKFVDLGKVLQDDTLSATKQTSAALITLGDSLQSLGAEGAVAKAGAVLAAIGQIILGFSSASAQAGSLGPFGWLAFVGAGLAAVATTISTIKGFNEGGIVGGSAHYGDTMLARVNSGEMVLTRTQQGNLFNLLDGKTGGARADDFKIVIKGSDLEISRKNYNSKMSKL